MLVVGECEITRLLSSHLYLVAPELDVLHVRVTFVLTATLASDGLAVTLGVLGFTGNDRHLNSNSHVLDITQYCQ